VPQACRQRHRHRRCLGRKRLPGGQGGGAACDPEIPAGSLEAGTKRWSEGQELWTLPPDEPLAEETKYTLTVSSFLISKFEVPQAQYLAVIGSNLSLFTGDTSRPVDSASWYGAVAYRNALSAVAGLNSCYAIAGDSTTCDFTRNGYRLPTEAE
jgi:formylglycine-generating enzyme required for sulfatase activity